MAKRFTDTNKYKKPFIRSLQGAYKLLWDFLYHDCDHAGIWIVDFEIAQTYVGNDMPVNRTDALRLFNSDEARIIEIDGGKKWFIPSFIEFQYGFLSEKNRAHINVISVLRKHKLLNNDLSIKKDKPLTSPLQGAKEQEQEKEKELEEEGGMGETIPVGIVPEMLQMFMIENPEYLSDQLADFPSLRLIAGKILKWEKLKGDITNPENADPIKRRWGELVQFIRADQHFGGYSLLQINKYFQSIVQRFSNAPAITNQRTLTGSDKTKPGTSEARVQRAKDW